jgi:hypothetical protein
MLADMPEELRQPVSAVAPENGRVALIERSVLVLLSTMADVLSR